MTLSKVLGGEGNDEWCAQGRTLRAGLMDFGYYYSNVKASEITSIQSPSIRSPEQVAKDYGINTTSTYITQPYTRPANATTLEQKASVQGKPCILCGAVTDKMVADHKTPLVIEYYKNNGVIDITKMKSVSAVQPQCPTCSAKQGAELSWFSKFF